MELGLRTSDSVEGQGTGLAKETEEECSGRQEAFREGRVLEHQMLQNNNG